MLQSIKNFFKDISTLRKDGMAEPMSEAEEIHLAAAALMFHVIAADGIVQQQEKLKLRSILSTNYDVDPRDIDKLIEKAGRADREAVDLYAFTSVLKRHLPEDDRKALIEHLWEMVFSDGEIHEFEDNIVWRVAELIAVSQQDRISMKQRVLARHS